MDRCVNCAIAFGRCNTVGRRSLDDENILTVIRQWLAPVSVNITDYVCQACWDLAQSPHAKQKRQLGHRNICLRCGRSLASRISHELRTNSTREARIYKVIEEWIIPHTIQNTSHICHTCWVAADRAAVRRTSGPSSSSQKDRSLQKDPQSVSPNEGISSNLPEPTIVLPEYMRAKETESRCFIEGCMRTERHRVPLSTRKMLVNQHKYYIPENNRLCDKHLVFEAWNFWDSLRCNCVQFFTAKHIEDMMLLKG